MNDLDGEPLKMGMGILFLCHNSPHNQDFLGPRDIHTTNMDNKGDTQNKGAQHIMNTFTEGVDVLDQVLLFNSLTETVN